jgi:membrane fusion protein (multidrug efflux system)
MKTSTLRRAALCLGLLALTACGGKAPPPPPPPPEVGVINAQPRTVPLERSLVGRLSSFRTADVRARVAGVLLKRTYAEGSDVKQGQRLFQIDPAPYQAALAAAKASLAQAQASYTNAHVNAERARQLAPKGYVSRSDLDNAEATERSAAASVAQMRANVESAQINLGYTDVTSPIDGRAGEQQVTEGALVGQGDATLLTRVDQLDPVYVNFTLSVADLEQMRSAARAGDITLADADKAQVRVLLTDGKPYPQPGLLDFSDTTVNPATGAVNLRAKVANPDRVLLPGMYATLQADLGLRHGVFLLPQPAVQRDPAGAYVLVVGEDGKVARKNVDLGETHGSDWLVTGGLKAGDQVIVSGVQKAKPGSPAKPTPWKPDAKPQGQPPGQGQPPAAASSK